MNCLALENAVSRRPSRRHDRTTPEVGFARFPEPVRSVSLDLVAVTLVAEIRHVSGESKLPALSTSMPRCSEADLPTDFRPGRLFCCTSRSTFHVTVACSYTDRYFIRTSEMAPCANHFVLGDSVPNVQAARDRPDHGACPRECDAPAECGHRHRTEAARLRLSGAPSRSGRRDHQRMHLAPAWPTWAVFPSHSRHKQALVRGHWTSATT